MFVKLQEGVYLNTDHIITIDVKNCRIETTPGVARSIPKDSPLVQGILSLIIEPIN